MSSIYEHGGITFTEVNNVDDQWKYFVRKKFDSGMTAEFGFHGYGDEGKHQDLYPYFTVFQKRNRKWPVDSRTTTGRDGLAPAMWALECLAAIEQPNSSSDAVRIVVEWVDDRRKDVYTRVLERRGYQRTFHHGVEVLTKLIERV